MASISSTDSIGNTSLRGYGGMASGIDRDAIIEKMTLGTTTKINNQQSKITQLQWKQEAYRNISDQIIDFGDKYTSFSSTDSLIDPNFFAKSIISVHGRDEATRFVTASGSSDLISNISIKGVKQLATSTVRQSDAHKSDGGLKTTLTDLNAEWRSSKLQGTQLIFEKPGENGTTADRVVLTLPDGYTEEDKITGKEVTKKIDYTKDAATIAEQLNKSLKDAEVKIGDKTIGEAFEFVAKDGKLTINFKAMPSDYQIRGGSTALSALGYEIPTDENGQKKYLVSIDELTSMHSGKTFEETGINKPSALDEMTGKKLTFNYDGSQKEIELITKEEADEIKAMRSKLASDDAKRLAEIWEDPTVPGGMDEFGELVNRLGLKDEEIGGFVEAVNDPKTAELNKMASNIQSRLDRAFGTGMVKADISSGSLSFTTENDESTISVVSNDYSLLTNLGITYGESNKVNLSGKLDQAALLGSEGMVNKFVKGDTDALDLEINGVAIEGLTKNSSINDILSKINATSEAGVKATYVSATGQFMLVSTETGAGRDITLDSGLAKELFGVAKKDENGKAIKNSDDTIKYDADAGISKGQDAIIRVSYGNGVDVDIKRGSNSFNLEGLDVTVTGTFGGEFVEQQVKENGKPVFETGEDGKEKLDEEGKPIPVMETVWKEHASQTVTFSAKADVDAIVERVKGFFEDFNKIATDVNNEITTRPDSSYGPLTDEQKKEMDDTSIENWEKKAKQGMLYGDSAMRDLSTDVQSVFLKLMNSMGKDGYEKLKQMGITYSDDYGDGGTISFDESKFRTAVEKDSEAVGNLFTGGGGVSKGLVAIMDETFTPYATRYASKNGGGKGSYGRLIEIAGSEKKPTSLLNNQIYNEIQNMQDQITRLREQLKTEQDRYISQFTTMESLLNQMNTQSSYLSQLTG